ncbi:MAG TPA: biliverdin-producing heme oxygenase, partial [Acidobacteriaceae bacterium]
AWEGLAAQSCPTELGDFFRSRRRAPLLAADLAFFHTGPIAAKPSLPSIQTPCSFWGAFYVMEGSTLGGQVIARQLQSALKLSGGEGYSYFLGYDALRQGGSGKSSCIFSRRPRHL